MEKDKLINLLNEALQNEYTDVFLYPRQADATKEKEISKKFEKFGRMELRHADNVAMQIRILGGQPKWEFEPIDSEESLDEMLQDNLEREKSQLQLYDKLIELVDEAKEDQLKLILKGIRSEEGSHLATIKELLAKRKIR